MTLRAVLFDMDGTLVDSEPTHHRALEDLMGGLGLAVPAGLHDAATGSALSVVHSVLVQACGLPMDLPSFTEAKDRAFVQRIAELRLRPGAQEALQVLRAAGLEMAIVSNSGRKLMDASLRAVGLHQPGLLTVSRDEVVRGKPAPDPYLLAAKLLHLAPAQCLVVEDSEVGVRAGLAADMPTLAWPEPHRKNLAFPDAAIRLSAGDGSELAAWLRSRIHTTLP